VNVNLGCGGMPVAGWTNLDVTDIGSISPDIIVPPLGPWPFESDSVTRVYAGHSLEHTVWEDLPILLAEIHRVLVPGGGLMIVGPDVFRMAEQLGIRNWLTMVGMESDESGQPDGNEWAEARHHWNCHEERLVRLLNANNFRQVEAVALTDLIPRGWPLFADPTWQCAALGIK